MSKKLIIILSIITGVVILAIIGYLIIQNRNLKKDLTKQSPTPTTTATITVSATASVKVTKTATKTATESTPTPAPTKSDDQLISEALASKLSQDASNLDVKISKKSEKAAYGSVSVKGEMGGGWFVAVEDQDQWKVIADGNGTIDCAILDQYNVPSSVVAECYDSATGESRTR